jgi:hypothetical protein
MTGTDRHRHDQSNPFVLNVELHGARAEGGQSGKQRGPSCRSGRLRVRIMKVKSNSARSRAGAAELRRLVGSTIANNGARRKR